MAPKRLSYIQICHCAGALLPLSLALSLSLTLSAPSLFPLSLLLTPPFMQRLSRSHSLCLSAGILTVCHSSTPSLSRTRSFSHTILSCFLSFSHFSVIPLSLIPLSLIPSLLSTLTHPLSLIPSLVSPLSYPLSLIPLSHPLPLIPSLSLSTPLSYLFSSFVFVIYFLHR